MKGLKQIFNTNEIKIEDRLFFIADAKLAEDMRNEIKKDNMDENLRTYCKNWLNENQFYIKVDEVVNEFVIKGTNSKGVQVTASIYQIFKRIQNANISF